MIRQSHSPFSFSLLASVLLLIVGMTACGPDASHYRFQHENVKGPVKQIVQRSYAAMEDTAGWRKGRLQGKTLLEYNREGRLISKRVYGPDTSLVERFEYLVSADGREAAERFNQSDSLTHTTTYSYPWLYGQVESASHTPNDSLRWYSVYKFDQNYRVTQQEIFGPSDRLNYRVAYRYNLKGLVMEKSGVEEWGYTFEAHDQYDNWTRRLGRKGKRVTRLTLRDITYYKDD